MLFSVLHLGHTGCEAPGRAAQRHDRLRLSKSCPHQTRISCLTLVLYVVLVKVLLGVIQLPVLFNFENEFDVLAYSLNFLQILEIDLGVLSR